MSAAVDSETKYEPVPERVWCIIGAGASGLVAMKELNEVGVKVSSEPPRLQILCVREAAIPYPLPPYATSLATGPE